MDRWEWTKVGAAVGSALAVIGVASWFSEQVMEPVYPEKAAYKVEGVPPIDLAALQRSWPEGLQEPGDPSQLKGYMGEIEKVVLPAPATGAASAAATAPVDLGTLLASASVDRGKNLARVCSSCHTFEQGGPNRIGPNLWAVVGRPIGSHGGFDYSQPVASHGGHWTYEQLDKYLTNPLKAIPGNKMAFNGIRNPKDRANLLAYLGSLNATPAPYPAPGPLSAGERYATATRGSP